MSIICWLPPINHTAANDPEKLLRHLDNLPIPIATQVMYAQNLESIFRELYFSCR